ncbi:uncharacterized protein B0H64DRAFT_401613 [Chaetomium fimeti]|uniref:SigF-like NTF2-like domain-containing protein n=1 Tax=Chaetomium fimeti TaxID=1854472 RepID=A0AAE0HFM9_9PEZI|nr:hypothetical protein B0H64DRAFT_401613 [Chaetomium fimeti]
MENPAQDIKHVLRTLTQGSPDAQHDVIYRYFAPGAVFEHPFCWVPSFKNVNVPRVGKIDSRVLIAAIYRWYKILSPKIEFELESCVYDERCSLLYLTIFQVFSLWFIPFHRAPVRLVTVLHLTPAPTTGDGTPPPPYDAAQEKRQAVLEGTEPSYAAVISGGASATPAHQPPQQQKKGEDNTSPPGSSAGGKPSASRPSSSSGSSSSPRPKRYVIAKQQDLYQVNECVKFVTLTSVVPIIVGFLQLLATVTCLIGATTLGPVMKAVRPAGGKEKA